MPPNNDLKDDAPRAALALKSDGSLRELTCLVQGACIEATADKIDQPAIDNAITNVRSQFIRPMTQAYFAALAKIHQSKDTDNTLDTGAFYFIVSPWSITATNG